MALGALAAATALLGACRPARPRVRCELGAEHLLGASFGPVFDDVAVARTGRGALALWSAREGTFAQPLGVKGAPSSGSRRLGPPCRGGLAATRAGDGVMVACLEPARLADEKAGAVMLLTLDAQGRVERRQPVGTAGPESEGVAVARLGARTLVAWQDAEIGRQRVWLAALGAPPMTPHVISQPGTFASGPALLADGSRVLVSWAELWRGDRAGFLHGRIELDDGRGAPHHVAATRWADPWPALARDGRGVVVGFRDLRPPRQHTGLFLARVGGDLEPTGEAVRAGRANGRGRPSLLPCERGLLTLAPRSFGHDVLIGLDRFDGALVHQGIERQVYEYGIDFTHAGAACMGDHAIALVAEQATVRRPRPHLRTFDVRCKE